MGPAPIAIAERFWPKVRKQSIGCWEWLGCRSAGYGQIWMDGRMVFSHRVSWMLCRGDIPHGLQVLHSCDNPLCVRPDHLFLGTQKENVADCIRKNRRDQVFGERNGSAKLTESDVRQIRRLLDLGHTATSLARRYSVHHVSISQIKLGKTWVHVS